MSEVPLKAPAGQPNPLEQHSLHGFKTGGLSQLSFQMKMLPKGSTLDSIDTKQYSFYQ